MLALTRNLMKGRKQIHEDQDGMKDSEMGVLSLENRGLQGTSGTCMFQSRSAHEGGDLYRANELSPRTPGSSNFMWGNENNHATRNKRGKRLLRINGNAER